MAAEKVMEQYRPEALLLLGDTNSALAAIAAKRRKIPIFHMEAGNRCFDQNVPEEINRKISDHISDINLTYTENSRRYLLSEGFRKDHVFVTGSPLKEVLVKNQESIDNSDILNKMGLKPNCYIVLSAHREENIDLKSNFQVLIEAVNAVANAYNVPIIFSTHPRTRKRMNLEGIPLHPLIKSVDPLSFFDYVQLQRNALVVLSDSGTISEESAMMNFSAVSIRTSTERPEAIDYGTIVLGGISEHEILSAIPIAISLHSDSSNNIPSEYNITNCSTRVIRVIQSYTSIVNDVIWRK